MDVQLINIALLTSYTLTHKLLDNKYTFRQFLRSDQSCHTIAGIEPLAALISHFRSRVAIVIIVNLN